MRKTMGFCIAGLAIASLLPAAALAVEGATGFYLLGSKGSLAGVVPPPGVYLQSDSYYYTGDASASRTLNIGGNIVADVQADAFYEVATGMWVMPQTVLGGNLGVGFSGVIGWKDVSASLVIDPIGGIAADDDETAFGDPVLSAVLGWHQDNWHWNVGAMVNVPVGQWERRRLANIGFNRWALDLNSAVTWLDASTGWEFSGAVGVTFNGENDETDYDSGTEFHLELAVVKNLSKQFAVGLAAYHYDQITGDSGAGARLGDFEGQVTAVGPMVKYSFQIGQTPVSSSFRWFHEFNVENRLEGDSAFLTLAIPLSVAGR